MAVRKMVPQTSFRGGVVDGEWRGRVDDIRVREGCTTLDNMLLDPSGSAIVRPGTIEAYFDITWGAGSSKFYMLPVSYGGAPYGHFLLVGFTGTASATGCTIYLVRPGAYGSADTLSGSVQLTTHTTATDLSYCQSGRSVFLAGTAIDPVQLVMDFGTSATYTLTLTERSESAATGPTNEFRLYQQLPGTVEFAATGTPVDGVVGTGTLFQSYFAINDFIRIGGITYKVTGISSPTNMTVDVYGSPGAGHLMPATNNTYPYGIFRAGLVKNNLSTGNNFRPSGVTMFKNRLVYVGSDDAGAINDSENKVWMSSSRDPMLMEPSLGAVVGDPSDPIQVNFLQGADDTFHWAESGDTLFIGGTSRAYAMRNPLSFSAEEPPYFTAISERGSATDSPVNMYDGKIMYRSADGVLVQAQYDFATDRYEEKQLNKYARRNIGEIVDFTFSPASPTDPVDRIYALNDAGVVWVGSFLGMEDGLPSWSKHTMNYPGHELVGLAGIQEVSDTTGTPAGAFGGFTVVYGAWDSSNTKFRMHATMAPLIGRGNIQVGQLTYTSNTECLDYPADYSAAYSAVVGGKFRYLVGATVSWLYGETVMVWGRRSVSDSYVLGYATIDGSGNLDLDMYIGDPAFIGIPFVGELTPTPVLSEDQLGPLINRPHRVVSARVRYERARMFYINDVPQLEQVRPQPAVGVDPPDPAPTCTMLERPLLDGVAVHRLLGWNYEPEITVRSAPPYQMRILSITREVAG